jgi:flagellar biosynthesis protein FliP
MSCEDIKADLKTLYRDPTGRSYSDFPNSKEEEAEEDFNKNLKNMLLMSIVNIIFSFIIIVTYWVSIERNYIFLDKWRTEIYKKSEDIELYYYNKGAKNPIIYVTLLPSISFIYFKKFLIEYVISFNVENNVKKTMSYYVTVFVPFFILALLLGSILSGIWIGISNMK